MSEYCDFKSFSCKPRVDLNASCFQNDQCLSDLLCIDGQCSDGTGIACSDDDNCLDASIVVLIRQM